MGHKADCPSIFLVQWFVKHFGFVKLRDAFIAAMKKNPAAQPLESGKTEAGSCEQVILPIHVK